MLCVEQQHYSSIYVNNCNIGKLRNISSSYQETKQQGLAAGLLKDTGAHLAGQ